MTPVVSGTATISGTLSEVTVTNTLKGRATVRKLTNGVESSTAVWNFTLTGSDVNASGSTPPALINFNNAALTPGTIYTVCERGLPATWTSEWKIDTNGDGVPDALIPFAPGVSDSSIPNGSFYSNVYDPNFVPYPGTYVNDTRCVHFKVTAGQTLAFDVNNSSPGGEPRTIGYWKNWNRCTGGGQVAVATANGGPANGWFLLDDLLLNPGYYLGPTDTTGLHLDGNSADILTGALTGSDCAAGVNILDKSDIKSGKKMASDGAYNMAAQLLAAELNYTAGAEKCSAADSAINGASNLLVTIKFNGTGAYLKGGAQYNQAIQYTMTLDQYNNGFLCP